VAGGNGSGHELNQFCNPHGLCVDDEQTIYIADYGNNRIMAWKNGATSGQIVAGENANLCAPLDVIIDKESDCLLICNWGQNQVVRWPRQNGTSGQTIISDIDCKGLAMDNNGYLYVSDQNKHEVRRWKMGDTSGIGTVVAGGNGQGNGLDQLDSPSYIFVDQDHSVYVSHYTTQSVRKWAEGAKEGIVVAGGQGTGKDVTQFYGPSGMIVDQLGTLYVADHNNRRIMRWPKGATQGTVIVGGNGGGSEENELGYPRGLAFDRQGNLYVTDIINHRVQKFNIDPTSNT
jgi:sugar lactone lactonase YvrE